PNPDGCARLVIDAATYDFSGKSGGLVVTMNPATGELTLEFDEWNNGSIDFQDSVTSVTGYLGYDDGGTSYREWSGGDPGVVGNISGNGVAGNEVSSANADFNGTMDGIFFSNTTENIVAWRSSYGTYTDDPAPPTNPILPDNRHNLLGFKLVSGTVYSTGANDDLLEFFLGDEIVNTDGTAKANYDRETFKAYSTNGVQNTTVPQHHIFIGDKVDGTFNETTTQFLTDPDPKFDEVRGLSMFEVLYDGLNGLDIGSGINNLNQTTSIQFFSGNGQVGSVGDGNPDLLIPNMAEAGGTDVYYFSDEVGNVIGRPIRLTINNEDNVNPPLSHWINDQYEVDLGVSFEIANPSIRIYGQKQERPMRLIALELDDFGITQLATTDPGYNYFSNIQSIFNINAGAGGTADVPFLAYNGDTFQIKSPIVDKRPVPRSVCEADGTANAEFEVEASVDGGFTGDPDENLNYQWYRYNQPLTDGATYSGVSTATLDVSNISSSELGLYRLKVWNTFGTTIVSVNIEEGGTRVGWDGSQWVYPPDGVGGTQVVADTDRKMVMISDYEIPIGGELEGCSCEVFQDREVVIRSTGAMKLFDNLVLRPNDTIWDPNSPGSWTDIIPAGRLILEDDASLVQIKDVDFNQNFGDMNMDRQATGLADLDYVYWSSPVPEHDIDDIPNSASFLWDVRAINANGTHGNWIAHGGNMTPGRGYIARVPFGDTSVPVTFKGVPNNGQVLINVFRSLDAEPEAPVDIADRHWNLVGNPYPSAVNALKFLTHNTILEGAVYLWNSNASDFSAANPAPYYENNVIAYADSYISHNGTGSNPVGFNGNIAAGQGFFVKLLPSASILDQVEFRNTMRYGSAQAVLPNNDFKSNNSSSNRDENQEKQLLWLFLSNDVQQSSSTLVGYVAGATNTQDRLYDAFANRRSGELAIHSFVEDSKMVIQGRSLPFDDQDLVPLGIQLPSPGVYRIGIDQLKGEIFEDSETNIILEDTYLGITHNLKESPYAFNVQVAGDYNDRFVLRYNANQLSTTDVEKLETFAFINNGRLTVQSSSMIESIQIFDLTGKQVLNIQNKELSNRVESNFNFSRGAYIAIVTLEGNRSASIKLIN
ncbi:MAG: hypothetical protein AAGH46_03620, partial [Bacteroidota bacterium]